MRLLAELLLLMLAGMVDILHHHLWVVLLLCSFHSILYGWHSQPVARYGTLFSVQG